MKLLQVSASTWLIMGICAGIAMVCAVMPGSLLRQAKEGKKPLQRDTLLAIIVCILMAVLATVIGKNEPYVGAPMVGLLLGILVVNLVPEKYVSKAFKAGATFSGKAYLSLGIVCLGATLAFTDLFSAAYALPLIVCNLLLSFGTSYLVGKKLLHVSGNTCALVGSGTAVCGGTAIAAVSPILEAKEKETAYAMTAIFLFDLLACLSYPYLAQRLGFSDVQFGFLAGTAVNDTSSVIAAQETFAALRGEMHYALPATIKVVRTTMILVLALVFSLVTIRRQTRDAVADCAPGRSVLRSVWAALPKFVLAFIVMIGLNTLLLGKMPDNAFYTDIFKPFFSTAYKFFVTVALCGVGYKIRFRELFTKGLKPIALGGCTWLVVFLSSMLFATFFADSWIG